MSDFSQGDGWWQASDGKWYAPELHPDYQPPTEAVPTSPSEPEPTLAQPMTPSEPEPTVAQPVAPEATQAIPTPAYIPPPVPPDAPIVGGPVGPPPGRSNAGKIIAIVVALILIAAAVLAFFLTRDNDKSSSSSSSSTSSSSTSSSSSSSSTTSSSSRSSSSSSAAGIDAKTLSLALLRPGDVGAGYSALQYKKPASHPLPCGQPDPDTIVKPFAGAGAQAVNDASTVVFLQEASSYTNTTDASKAFQLQEAGVACGSGPLYDDQGNAVPATFGPTTDVSSQVGAAAAVEVPFSTSSINGTAVLVRSGTVVYTIVIQHQPDIDPTTVPDPIAVTKAAQAQIAKIS